MHVCHKFYLLTYILPLAFIIGLPFITSPSLPFRYSCVPFRSTSRRPLGRRSCPLVCTCIYPMSLQLWSIIAARGKNEADPRRRRINANHIPAGGVFFHHVKYVLLSIHIFSTPCHATRSQETESVLNTALIENYNVMVGLYARLGVAPGVTHTLEARLALLLLLCSVVFVVRGYHTFVRFGYTAWCFYRCRHLFALLADIGAHTLDEFGAAVLVHRSPAEVCIPRVCVCAVCSLLHFKRPRKRQPALLCRYSVCYSVKSIACVGCTRLGRGGPPDYHHDLHITSPRA